MIKPSHAKLRGRQIRVCWRSFVFFHWHFIVFIDTDSIYLFSPYLHFARVCRCKDTQRRIYNRHHKHITGNVCIHVYIMYIYFTYITITLITWHRFSRQYPFVWLLSTESHMNLILKQTPFVLCILTLLPNSIIIPKIRHFIIDRFQMYLDQLINKIIILEN